MIVKAKFANGVFVPEVRPSIEENASVRLTVEPANDAASDRAEDGRRAEALANLRRIWDSSKFRSVGAYPTREELHDRRL